MIKYILKKNNNKSSAAYGKYYAYPVVDETMDLESLAQHMEEHNTGFSEAMCVGVMKAMVKCIKEQLLAGKNVKIDNLAIFSCGIKNRQGAATEEEFSVTNNISGVKLRARATGTLSNANLNLAASIKKASTVLGTTTTGTSTSTTSGSTTQSGGTSTSGSTTDSGSTSSGSTNTNSGSGSTNTGSSDSGSTSSGSTNSGSSSSGSSSVDTGDGSFS